MAATTKKNLSNVSFERELRISFLRFHSEFESLKIVFKAISDDKIKVDFNSSQSHILQKYLNRAISTILKSELNTTCNKAQGLVDYFRNMFSQFQPGELSLLKSKLHDIKFRPQIERKTLNFIINHIEKNEMKITQTNNNSQVINQENSGSGSNHFEFNSNSSVNEINFKAINDEVALLRLYYQNNQPVLENIELNNHLVGLGDAAENENENDFLNHLKNCGKWILDTGTKIAIPLIVELIKRQTIK